MARSKANVDQQAEHQRLHDLYQRGLPIENEEFGIYLPDGTILWQYYDGEPLDTPDRREKAQVRWRQEADRIGIPSDVPWPMFVRRTVTKSFSEKEDVND